MSYTIEFDRMAVSVSYDPPEEYEHETDVYLLLHKLGDNNVLNRDDTIAKDWRFAAIGTETEVLKELTLALGDIEKGMFQYQNGRTKIENYLSNWRKTIRDPITVFDLQNKSSFTDGELVLRDISDPDEDDTVAWEALDTVTTRWERDNDSKNTPPEYSHEITEQDLITLYELRELAIPSVRLTEIP